MDPALLFAALRKMAEEPPAAKRAKLGDIPEHLSGIDTTVKRTIVIMDGVQTEIDSMNEKASEEILKIEQKYNGLRAPLFEQRAELIKDVPHFWSTAILNHPQLGSIVEDSEVNLLQAITSMEVEEFEPSRGFKIRFDFAPNDYFDETMVQKVFTLGDNPCTTTTQITWRPGKRPALSENTEALTFAEWLAEDIDPTVDDICELIKDDLWSNPVQYFLCPNVEDAGEDMIDLVDEDDEEDDDETNEVSEVHTNGTE